jgi:hypothetical protein
MLRLKRAENVRGRANERDPRAEQDGVAFEFFPGFIHIDFYDLI